MSSPPNTSEGKVLKKWSLRLGFAVGNGQVIRFWGRIPPRVRGSMFRESVGYGNFEV